VISSYRPVCHKYMTVLLRAVDIFLAGLDLLPCILSVTRHISLFIDLNLYNFLVIPMFIIFRFKRSRTVTHLCKICIGNRVDLN
jgi:hypothetical protein